jgi:ubiquinone/menaquinone biosynthesis C-methylase UbiE
MKADSFTNIDKGFSSIYDEYEKISREDIIDISRRNCIRNQVNSFLKPNHKILEINAGSGIDAVYFAQNGNFVLATDIATNSEIYILSKIKTLGLKNLQFQKCSFTSLNSIKSGTFNHIFSNYGGLNCIANLTPVFNQFDSLLNPNGFVTLVIMPSYYPWEMATILKGNKNAFRRFKKNGVLATVGNQLVPTFYYSPKQVKRAMGDKFKHIKTQNIGTFYPSSHFSSLQKNQKAISNLLRFDLWINRLPFMIKGVGDYFVITFQKIN